MIMRPRLRFGALLALLIAGAGACAGLRTIRYTVPRKAPPASDFAAIRQAWSRDASVVPVSGLENVLTLTATCMSPEFRAAYVSRYGRDYQLGPGDRAALLHAQQATAARELQFFVTAFSGTEFRDADLSDPDRGWRVLLVTAHGRWAHTRLERIVRPTAVQRAYFPQAHAQRMVFLVGFPPVVTPEDRWFRMHVVSARGQAELEWRLGD
jgi:hypothetical protein